MKGRKMGIEDQKWKSGGNLLRTQNRRAHIEPVSGSITKL
jgi:hypothetical protein